MDVWIAHQILKEISDLPAREAYLWVRGSGAKAVRIRINSVANVSQASAIRTNDQLFEHVRSRISVEEKQLLSLESDARDNTSKKSVEEFLSQFEKEYPPDL